MRTDDIVHDLDRAMTSSRYLWVETAQWTLMGFVVGLGPTVVLIRRFHDFAEDGYVLLRVDLVEEVVESNENFEFFEKMMRLERTLERSPTLDFDVTMLTMASALDSIRARDLLVIVRHDQDVDESEFMCGKLLSVDVETCLHRISASGKWENEVRAPTSSIQRVDFATPYLRAYAKYGEPYPKKVS